MADNIVEFSPGGGGGDKSGGTPPADGGPWDGDPIDLELCKLPTNDLGLAERLIKRSGDDLAASIETGWAVWDGARYQFDRGEWAARRKAHDTARLMAQNEYCAFKTLPIPAGFDPDNWKKVIKSFYSAAQAAGNFTKTRAMLAQAEAYLGRRIAEFDVRGDSLTCPNATVRLEIPTVRSTPHKRADLSTKVTGADFDPDAKCPAFEAHMKKVQPDPVMRAFVQRCLGYALMGGNREQIFLIFQGKGGDGKSTTLMAIRHALGEYCAAANIETFLHQERKSGSAPSPDIARLSSGVRVVMASEPEQGAVLSGSFLKRVTGGEPITARHLLKGDFEFLPKWVLIISCNRKPRILGDDDGIWRRTVVVPWPVQISDEDRNKDIVDALRGEASGILNWLIEGLIEYHIADGLDPPQEVLTAQEDYRVASNPFGEWYNDRVIAEKGAETLRSSIYGDYTWWCEDNEVEPMSARALYRILADRQHPAKKTNGNYMLLNARLKFAPKAPL